jgi:dolichol kinase
MFPHVAGSGDGFADIVGRAYGSRPGYGGSLPWCRAKSCAGSAAFFFLSWSVCALYGAIFISLGYFQPLSLTWYQLTLPFVVAIATLVESAPIQEYDNITVFAAAVICGKIVWSGK